MSLTRTLEMIKVQFPSSEDTLKRSQTNVPEWKDLARHRLHKGLSRAPLSEVARVRSKGYQENVSEINAKQRAMKSTFLGELSRAPQRERCEISSSDDKSAACLAIIALGLAILAILAILALTVLALAALAL